MPGKAPPPKALVEQRLRVIYDAKPGSMPAWGSSTFLQCLAARQVPLDADRSGVCYLLSYYLAVVVPGYRKQGLPNYTVFDEKRYFAAGDQAATVELDGVRFAPLI